MPIKRDVAAYRREHPEDYDYVKLNYAPIFDMWVAIDLYINNIPPPTCNICGRRLKVDKRMGANCSSCSRNIDKYAYDRFIVKALAGYEYPRWDDMKSTQWKVPVICPVHGEFQQVMASNFKGHGCSKCKKSGVRKHTFEEFLEISKRVHNNFYSYEKVTNYRLVSDRLIITCPEHGDFEQVADLHLRGRKCRRCAAKPTADKLRCTTEEFVRKANARHSNKYSYGNTVYEGITKKIIITCPTHGDFEQFAGYHLNCGNGCQKCGLETTYSKSSAEYEIKDYIESIYSGEVIHGTRVLGVETDIYLPDKKLAIEYDGLYWHSSDSIDTDKALEVKHLNKTNVCAQHGVELLHIFEHEWVLNPDMWKSMIRQKLGLSERIYARKCEVRKIENKVAYAFCKENHLQGSINAIGAYGLFYKDVLYCVLTFGKSRYSKYNYEILRFCTLAGYSVTGGFSKILTEIGKHYKGTFVSYANKRWSTGNLYEKTGFTYVHDSVPCFYWWKKGYTLQHRSAFTKKTMATKLEVYDEALTGVENMYNNGYSRIWDCGNKVYIKEFK